MKIRPRRSAGRTDDSVSLVVVFSAILLCWVLWLDCGSMSSSGNVSRGSFNHFSFISPIHLCWTYLGDVVWTYFWYDVMHSYEPSGWWMIYIILWSYVILLLMVMRWLIFGSVMIFSWPYVDEAGYFLNDYYVKRSTIRCLRANICTLSYLMRPGALSPHCLHPLSASQIWCYSGFSFLKLPNG
jgi:hypothetical protein